jgi:hypothetical protein
MHIDLERDHWSSAPDEHEKKVAGYHQSQGSRTAQSSRLQSDVGHEDETCRGTKTASGYCILYPSKGQIKGSTRAEARLLSENQALQIQSETVKAFEGRMYVEGQ